VLVLRGPNEIAPFGASLPRLFSREANKLSLWFAKLGRSGAARTISFIGLREAEREDKRSID
jgi:hypothetical protein